MHRMTIFEVRRFEIGVDDGDAIWFVSVSHGYWLSNVEGGLGVEGADLRDRRALTERCVAEVHGKSAECL
jgi:hypothetical protein